MTIRKQLSFWFATLLVFVLFLYIFSPILLPFVAGMALAYLLDPTADWLEARGMSRLLATLTILVLFVVIFLLALLLILPVLGGQLAGFMEKLPMLVQDLQNLIAGSLGDRLKSFFGVDVSDLKSNMGDIVGKSASWIGGLAKSLWSGGQTLLSVVSLFVVTPVVAFYLLLDWDRMVERIDGWLPRRHQETIRELAREMDRAVAGFVRGQFSVCLILGTFYAAGLAIVGLNFGLLIGLGAGLVSFIPYIGATLGFTVSLGVALVQFWPDGVMITAVFIVFAIGQFLEGNILQPKLVGESVGLHPVWLMFALFAFGYLFGFVGMLVAVPVAAMLGVLARFALKQYLASPLYLESSRNSSNDE